MDAVRAHEVALTAYALDALGERFGDDLRIFGPPGPTARGGVISFAYRDVHPHDLVPGPRPVRGVRPGRPPLRQAADAAPRRQRHRPGLVRTSTTTSPTSTPWPTPSPRPVAFFG